MDSFSILWVKQQRGGCGWVCGRGEGRVYSMAVQYVTRGPYCCLRT
jgi:hypothetical protein